MELIKIGSANIGNEVKETVNARDLHSFLESKQEFATWIKNRIEQYGFIENTDYVVDKIITQYNQIDRIDYYLTIDTAKEISMVERNDKGKQARLYFIECERRARDPLTLLGDPKALLSLVQVYAHKQLELQSQIQEMTPKVEFYDAVTGSNDTIDMGTAAKVLNMGIGRTRLFALLRDKKILQPNNQPYQRYIDDGYFRIIESKYIKPDGSTNISIKTVVYQKGLDYIRKVVSES